ncbi:hypothetical protein BKA62DRAFT_790509 [Auriculariales sp. MPI-PUGE-AT-0066]|nr:hypothetical protein BKA62DRAFT_790509 [Auriculariales sp. MPI-PUGE-AT-0066]
MPHECRVWLRNGICDICQASLGVVNVLRHLRKWEQVIDGAFTKDQIAFDLERLCNDHESRRERDHSLLDSQMVIVFLDGRQVTLNTIPSYTRAGLVSMAKLSQIGRSVCSLQASFVNHCNEDPHVFWRILVGHVPACQQFVDEYLSALDKASFESDLTTPLSLFQGNNYFLSAQQLHDVPAGVFDPVRPRLPLAGPKPQPRTTITPVVDPRRYPTRRAAASPPVASTVAKAGRAIAGTTRFKKSQLSLDDAITKALDTKVNQIAQNTAIEVDGRTFIPRYQVYERLCDKGKIVGVASFLIARWPELLDCKFADDQIIHGGDLQKALRGFTVEKLSSKAQLARAKYLKTRISPPAGSGYQDSALFDDKVTEDAEMLDTESVDGLMEDDDE